MPESIQRTKGLPQGYKFSRGGTPTEFGPFIGIVVNNIDPTRSGRLQVWIEQFGATDVDGAPNFDDKSTWRTVSYIPPFYGVTPHTGTDSGAGTFGGNQQSYGMWFTPPDLYTQVICFFVAGDPNQGYYMGCVPEPGINHMVPAIGASRRYALQNGPQDSYFQGASQLPVTEINSENIEISENPRFFDQQKPVHSVVSGILLQQGLIKDTVRGPITSNSQRESPSSVFGISTPGQAIYQGGLSERNIREQLERGNLRPQDIEVTGRRGGHSLVMDDGDLDGKDNLIRIRTSKGHQITMSDDGDCFYITHANGQTWLEFGKQGTVDVFSTNSVNIRTQGTLNLHADKEINMYAGTGINVKSKAIKVQASASLDLIGDASVTIYSKSVIGAKSDGSLFLKNTGSGAWDGGSSLNLFAGCVGINSGGSAPVQTPQPLIDLSLADTKWVNQQGWTVEYSKLKTIVTRAPTHEPYPYHNQGVNSVTELTPVPTQPLSAAAAETLAGVQNIPVTNGIDTAAFLSQPKAELSVGTLDQAQVTGLLAQTAADVSQPFDAVSVEKGIGQYGFSPETLEASGFLKPGTVDTFLKNPNQLESVLSSPSVWTGKAGVVGLPNLLADPGLQSTTQNEIMLSSLQGLKSAGVVTGLESPQELAGFVQTASKFGIDNTVQWVRGRAPEDLVQDINNTARSAQYAVDFVDTKVTTLTGVASGGGLQLGGFSGTTERSDIDFAVTEVIGDDKVPSPIYSDEGFEEYIGDQVSNGVDLVRTAGTEAAQTAAQRIEILENEIFNLQGTIKFRQRRGRDASDLEARVLDLEQQLAALRTGV